nr:DUF6345 domain-containing protein [Archangium primigenium]
MAQQFSYSAAHITSWDGCECSSSSLSFTDDQMNGFDAALASRGHIRMHRFANTDVWASDYTEDSFGGFDHISSDDSDLIAYSGHGAAPKYSSGQTYKAPVCRSGSTSSCWFDSQNIRFGERSGSHATPFVGETRWSLWFTCYSVDERPDQQWGAALLQGHEYVMGYRDTSLDFYTTDEVPSDWVDRAIGGADSFKSAWFWAVEDWWANDTGGLVTAGPDSNSTLYRLDHLNKTWARRDASDYGLWIAWSYHQG